MKMKDQDEEGYKGQDFQSEEQGQCSVSDRADELNKLAKDYEAIKNV